MRIGFGRYSRPAFVRKWDAKRILRRKIIVSWQRVPEAARASARGTFKQPRSSTWTREWYHQIKATFERSARTHLFITSSLSRDFIMCYFCFLKLRLLWKGEINDAFSLSLSLSLSLISSFVLYRFLMLPFLLWIVLLSEYINAISWMFN